MHASVDDVELAGIDAIEAEHRQHRRKRACRASGDFLEDLVHPQFVGQESVALAPPVVEIAGNQQRCVARHGFADACDERTDLPLPATLKEPEMHVDAMQDRGALSQLDFTMQQPAAFEQMRRDILVFLRDDREARQDRVTVMTLAVHGVAPVGHFMPHRVGNEFVLRLARPVAITAGIALMRALDLLQEQDVSGQAVQLFLELMDDHAPRELRESFMDIEGRDGKSHRRGRVGRREFTCAMVTGIAGPAFAVGVLHPRSPFGIPAAGSRSRWPAAANAVIRGQ